MLNKLLSLLFGSALDRALKSVDNYVTSDVKREEVRVEFAKAYLESQTQILTGKGWWFPLLFIVPFGLWFASVCIYSILFCQSCVLPQTWSIAALPYPLNEYGGWIVASLFAYKTFQELPKMFTKK